MKRGLVFILVGAAVLLVSAGVGAGSPAGFLRGYLIGWLLCVGISLGAMATLMMHYLTGGAWGFPVRRFGEAAAMTLPLLALAGLPLVFGGAFLFPWANSHDVAGDALLQHRAVAFAPPLVIARAVFYFLIWSGLAWWLRRLSLRHDRTGDIRLLGTARRISAIGLVIYFITMSLAAVDWIGSREVDWYSSTFGLVTVVGQAVAGTAFLILMLTSTRAQSLRALATEWVLHDLGNLLQTVVVLWAYISFAQFLVIWVGNTQEDIIWFHHRNQGGWRFVTMSLVVFHFGFPFLLLLFQRAKRSARGLGAVAAGVLVMRGVDVIWLVVPSAHGPDPSPLTGFDVVVPIALLSVWFGVWGWLILRQALVPQDGVPGQEVQHGSAIATGAERQPGGYETVDLSLRGAIIAVVGLAAFAFVVHWALLIFWRAEARRAQAGDRPLSAVLKPAATDGPALQPSAEHDRNPAQDLAALRAADERAFNSLGWTTRDGSIRVPDAIITQVAGRKPVPAVRGSTRPVVPERTPIPGVDEGAGK